jgi:hypothetical protein
MNGQMQNQIMEMNDSGMEESTSGLVWAEADKKQ